MGRGSIPYLRPKQQPQPASFMNPFLMMFCALRDLLGFLFFKSRPSCRVYLYFCSRGTCQNDEIVVLITCMPRTALTATPDIKNDREKARMSLVAVLLSLKGRTAWGRVGTRRTAVSYFLPSPLLSPPFFSCTLRCPALSFLLGCFLRCGPGQFLAQICYFSRKIQRMFLMEVSNSGRPLYKPGSKMHPRFSESNHPAEPRCDAVAHSFRL